MFVSRNKSVILRIAQNTCLTLMVVMFFSWNFSAIAASPSTLTEQIIIQWSLTITKLFGDMQV
jgi:hypothetical protein